MSSDLSVIDADWNVEDGQVETAPLSNGSNGELSNTVILSIVVSCMAVFMVLTAVILHAQGFFRRVDYAELQRKALTKRKRRQKELLTAKFGTGM
jgi:hypothetical protein